MNRQEAVLRELNLFPLWVPRGAPVQDEVMEAAPVVHIPQIKPPPVVESLLPSTPIVRQDVAINLDWAGLAKTVAECRLCKLCIARTQAVLGVGDVNARWLFVGEGPGEVEDQQGEPFVGPAGKLLDNMLRAIRLQRGQDVYIANVVKCRPPANRTPNALEIEACMPYLKRQVELIQPKLIVALGKTAVLGLLGQDVMLGSLRGRVHDYNGIPVIVTYHPAYLLRNTKEKAKAWQDLCFAMKISRSLEK